MSHRQLIKRHGLWGRPCPSSKGHASRPDYDLNSYDYIDFLCNSNYAMKNIQLVTRKAADCSRAKRAGHVGNLNYPVTTAVFQQHGKQKLSTHFIRSVTNVGGPDSVYTLEINAPDGAVVTVGPERLAFQRNGQKLNFVVRVQVKALKLSPGSSGVKSGSVVWFDGKHLVTRPIVVTLQRPL